MNFRVKFSIFASFLWFSTNSFAQKSKIDSLKNQLLLVKPDSSKAKIYSKLGSIYADAQSIDSSVYFSQMAINFYQKNKNLKAVSYENLILGYRFKDIYKFPEAKKHFTKSLDFAKQIKNEAYEIAAYEGLGWLYHEMGNHIESNEYFAQALIIAKNIKDEETIIQINTSFGNNYIAMGKYQAAQVQYLKAANYYKKKNDLKNYAAYLSTYGNLFRKINQSHNAEKPLLEAYKIQKKIDDKWSLIDATRFLGMLYTETKDFKKAAMFFEESQNLAKEFNDNGSILKLYYSLERFYYVKNDISNGDKYQKLILKMRDSLYTSEKNKQLAEFDIKYKIAEKEAKLAESQLEIAQKRNWIIGLGITFLSIIGFGLLFWRIQKDKQKAVLQDLEIENTRKILNARQIERQRIAKELHDSVGSQLTIVSTSLDNAFFLAENHRLIPQKLESINVEVREAAQSLRDTIWATHNTVIPISNLYARMQHYLNKVFSENEKIIHQATLSGTDEELNSIEALNLFRIFQESVQNIQKHSEASVINLSLENHEHQLKLSISDNGIGFEMNDKNPYENFGLSNMKLRSEEINASLSITSKINKGTTIEVLLNKKATE